MAMASTTILLAAAFLAFAAAVPPALAQAPGPAAPATPANLTAVLVKGGQYTTFLRLLKETQIDTQINSQLNNSFNGLTVFAPTDNAFNSLKAGTLNGLSQQEQVALVLYHVLPSYYSVEMFQTASNPVRTQASGSTGVYTVNITASTTSNQVNVSTGVDTATVNNALSASPPLAVYSIETVLLPYELFGPKPPAAAPTAPKTKPKTNGSAGAAEAPAATKEGSNSGAHGVNAMALGWSLLGAVGLAGVLGGLL